MFKASTYSGLSVLIAEDEGYNYMYLEELLSDLELNLIHAKDGKESVEICQSNSNIDLVLMDVEMPIMDGCTAAKIIKSLCPDLIIIAQSAYTSEQLIEKYKENPFDDYIAKPIREDDLKELVLKYIDK